MAEEVDGLSLEDLLPDPLLPLWDLSDLLPDLLGDSDLSPEPDFSLDWEPELSLDWAFSEDDPFDPPESLELELLLRESVT